MAKKKKRSKVNKETRALIEALTDMTKRSGNAYKFKSGAKKKAVRRAKKTCVHMRISKGRETPALEINPQNSEEFRCLICGATFPQAPLDQQEYDDAFVKVLKYINQIQFYANALGCDSEDSRLIIQLKASIPTFMKIQRNVRNDTIKRQKFEDNRANTNNMSQFDMGSGYSYLP